MSLVILLCVVALDCLGLIPGGAAQTLYGVDLYPPELPVFGETIYTSITYFPVATGTDGLTTWMAQEILSLSVTTGAWVVPSNPITTSYLFVPTPGGLEATVGTTTLATLTTTARSQTVTQTLTFAPERLSCTFNGSSLAVCEDVLFIGDVGSVGSELITETLPVIPIFTLAVETSAESPTPTSSEVATTGSGKETSESHSTGRATVRIAGIVTGVGVSLMSLLVAGLCICFRRRKARGGRHVVDMEELREESSALPLRRPHLPVEPSGTGSTRTGADADAKPEANTDADPRLGPILALENPTSLERGAVQSQAETLRKVASARRRQEQLVNRAANERVADMAEQMRVIVERMGAMEARVNGGQRGDTLTDSPPEYTG
uniref:Mid2 domain-containing protein n=1 Tax=Mycena chlorophos TaxID=658473 RepID=A0ABQ0L9P2_MYCCL|nr:predicted protein [Mycena chlorophos]